MALKNSLKTIIKKIPIRFTSNQKYDAQTKRIMNIVVERHSTFVDVGCHKGEVLSKALKIANVGKHFAFEPIPSEFSKVNSKMIFSRVKLTTYLCHPRTRSCSI